MKHPTKLFSTELKLLNKEAVKGIKIEIINIEDKIIRTRRALRIGWWRRIDTEIRLEEKIQIIIVLGLEMGVDVGWDDRILKVEFPVDVDWHLEEDGALAGVGHSTFDLLLLWLWDFQFLVLDFWFDVLDAMVLSFVLLFDFNVFFCGSEWSSSFLNREIYFAFYSFFQAMGAWWKNLVTFMM